MSNVVRNGDMQIFIPQLETDFFNNQPMIDYDSYAASMQISQQDYASKNFAYADGSFDKYTFTVFQYCDSNPEMEQTKEALIDHYKGFGATDIEFLHTTTGLYSPRWNVSDTAKGLHWNMYDLQGENSLWILGGAFSFDSLNSVIGYNQLLLQNMNWNE